MTVKKIKQKPGPKPLSEGGSKPLYVRLPIDAATAVHKRAAAQGLTASAWARKLILGELKK